MQLHMQLEYATNSEPHSYSEMLKINRDPLNFISIKYYSVLYSEEGC